MRGTSYPSGLLFEGRDYTTKARRSRHKVQGTTGPSTPKGIVIGRAELAEIRSRNTPFPNGQSLRAEVAVVREGVPSRSPPRDTILEEAVISRRVRCIHRYVFRTIVASSHQMRGLGRVNLLVGTNNCGKTSILECIQLLRSAGNPHVLSSIAGVGESGATRVKEMHGLRSGTRSELLDLSHLFANRQFHRTISVEADRIGDAAAGWNDEVTVSVDDRYAIQHNAQDTELREDNEGSLLLRVKWSDVEVDYDAAVTEEGFLLGSRRFTRTRDGFTQAVPFVRTSGVTAADVVRTFSKFVLTPKHEPIKQALRIIEPDDRRPRSNCGWPYPFQCRRTRRVVLRLPWSWKPRADRKHG